MASVFTDAEIEAQIAVLKVELTAVNAAITALLAGAQSYTLDTGQTRETVTRTSLGQLRAHRKDLLAEVQELQDQLTGTASYVARPGW
jgi:hypothetical protein